MPHPGLWICLQKAAVPERLSAPFPGRMPAMIAGAQGCAHFTWGLFTGGSPGPLWWCIPGLRKPSSRRDRGFITDKVLLFPAREVMPLKQPRGTANLYGLGIVFVREPRDERMAPHIVVMPATALLRKIPLSEFQGRLHQVKRGGEVASGRTGQEAYNLWL